MEERASSCSPDTAVNTICNPSRIDTPIILLLRHFPARKKWRRCLSYCCRGRFCALFCRQMQPLRTDRCLSLYLDARAARGSQPAHSPGGCLIFLTKPAVEALGTLIHLAHSLGLVVASNKQTSIVSSYNSTRLLAGIPSYSSFHKNGLSFYIHVMRGRLCSHS